MTAFFVQFCALPHILHMPYYVYISHCYICFIISSWHTHTHTHTKFYFTICSVCKATVCIWSGSLYEPCRVAGKSDCYLIWSDWVIWLLTAKWRGSVLWIPSCSCKQFANTSVLPGLWVWASSWWVWCHTSCSALYG